MYPVNSLKRLYIYIEEFLLGNIPDVGPNLVNDRDRTLFDYIKDFVKQANSTDAQTLLYIFEECQNLLCQQKQFLSALSEYYECKGYIGFNDKDSLRIFTNIQTLFATAKVAFLAKRTVKTHEDLFTLLCYTKKVILICNNLPTKECIFSDTKVDIEFFDPDPAKILNQCFSDLVNNQKDLSVTKAFYWSLYWLDSTQIFHSRDSIFVKVFSALIGKGNMSTIELQPLKLIGRSNIVEHPNSCLLPIKSDLIESVNDAWQLNEPNLPNLCWEFQGNFSDKITQSGPSLSGAVAAAVYTIKNNCDYDNNRIILAQVQRGSNELIAVGDPDKKLHEILQQKNTDLKAAIVCTKKGTNGYISDLEIKKFDNKGLPITFIKTLEDAYNFVTIRPWKLLSNIPDLPNHFLPRSDEVLAIIDKLLDKTDTKINSVVALIGKQGVGKTVLAHAIAKSEDYKLWKRFPDGVFLVKIGKEPTEKYLITEQTKLLRSLEYKDPNVTDSSVGKDLLKKASANKVCLIILDDVWKHQHYEVFNAFDSKCRLLFTTSQNTIVNKIRATKHFVKALSKEEGLELLTKYSGKDIGELSPEDKEYKAAHTLAEEWCEFIPKYLSEVGSLKQNGISWTSILSNFQNCDFKILLGKELKVVEFFIQKHRALNLHNSNVLVESKPLESQDKDNKPITDKKNYFILTAIFIPRKLKYVLLFIAIFIVIGSFSCFLYLYYQPIKPTTINIEESLHMISIQGDVFTMGSNEDDVYSKPAHKASVANFEVSLSLITNEQYSKFINDLHYPPPEGWNNVINNMREQPITNITWNDADRYCQWLNNLTGKNYRLLDENEWEYLARFNNNKFQIKEILGNYTEWTKTPYTPYPGANIKLPPPMKTGKPIVFRGKDKDATKGDPITFRLWEISTFKSPTLSFRIARSMEEK